MSTLTILLCMASAAVLGLSAGVHLGIMVRKRAEGEELAALRYELQCARARATKREHDLWILIGQYHREIIATIVGRS